MGFIEIVNIREVTFIGLERDYLVCDIEWAKAKRENRKIEGEEKKVLCKYETTDAKLKLDTSNPKLLEKAKALNLKDKIYVKFYVPKGVDMYDTNKLTVLDILDEIDLLELQMNNQNENALFSIPGDKERINKILEDKRVEYATKKTKSKNRISAKDKRIAELEQENAQLRLQIQALQEQLQNS